jgi:uncharacterized protein involved in exopolysaccharide biosynthesis
MEALKQHVLESDAEMLRTGTIGATPVSTQAGPSSEWFVHLQSLWERRVVLYKATLVGLLIGIAVAFLIPKRFESTVTVMPPDSLGGNSMMLAALAGKASPELAGMAASALGIKSTGELFVGLLHSRTVEEGIVDRFQLQSVYWVRYKQDARKILERHTEIAEDRKTGIITLVVSDRQPQRAREMAQAFVEGLNSLVAQVSTSSARRERVFIEQRLSVVKTDLEDAEQQFSAFASKNTALDIKEQTRAMVDSAATLQGRLIAAESQVEGLRQIYNPHNVRVRSAQAEVDELKQQLAKIGGTDPNLSADPASSDQLYPSIRKLPLLGVQWADLFRCVKIQETVYELLNQQYELARIQEAKEVPTVNVIDSANLPEKKSWPPRLLIIAGFTVLALAATLGKIIAAERIEALDESDPRRQLAIAGSKKWHHFRAHFGSHDRLNGTNGSRSATHVSK